MVQVARIIGGAGTGKTSKLLSLMQANIERGTCDPYSLGFVSFTRAARREASTRAGEAFGHKATDLESHGWFRTLHSICYRQLQAGDELLTDKTESKKWIEAAVGYPVSGTQDASEGGLADSGNAADEDADKALAIWSLARNRLEPLDDICKEITTIDWKTPPLEFVADVVTKYEQAKRLDGRFDFTDLLGRFAGIKFGVEGHAEKHPEGEIPNVPVWFLDEQQDTSALLDRVCQRLVSTSRFAYLALDVFQAIYGFSGASSKHAMAWDVQQGKQFIMPQSYRCAERIFSMGENILRGCSDYWDRKIKPARDGGSIDNVPFFAGQLENLVDPSQEWLIIARANFHVNRIIGHLNGAGIPWIPTRGSGGWAPCKRMTASTALYMLETGAPVPDDEWKAVIESLPAKQDGNEVLVRGVKSAWKKRETTGELIHPQQVTQHGGTEFLKTAIQNGTWTALIDHGERFRIGVKRWGADALFSKIRVGTIHSVKGAEAENVAVLTSGTQKIWASTTASESVRDEELRISYVATTRAKNRLVVMDEGAKYRMEGF